MHDDKLTCYLTPENPSRFFEECEEDHQYQPLLVAYQVNLNHMLGIIIIPFKSPRLQHP